MADLLPSTSDVSQSPDAEPRVVGVDSDDADAMLSALSSETARAMLQAFHEEPDTPSGMADRLDTSLQNVQYHLGNLREADLVEGVDTVYSEKGREMTVYAPTDEPLVVYAGKESETMGLKQAVKRLLGALGVLAVLSVAVQAWVGELPLPFGTGGAAESEVMTASQKGARTGIDAAGGLPPGVLFFLGGVAVLLGVAAVWFWQR